MASLSQYIARILFFVILLCQELKGSSLGWSLQYLHILASNQTTSLNKDAFLVLPDTFDISLGYYSLKSGLQGAQG